MGAWAGDGPVLRHQYQHPAVQRVARNHSLVKAQDGLKQQVLTKTTELDGLRKKVELLEATAQTKANKEKGESAGL